MRLLLLFDLGSRRCRRWMIVHAVLLQPLLPLHERGRIFSKFLAHLRILGQEGFQLLVMLQVSVVIDQRRIFLKILLDTLMLIEEMIHLLKFLLVQVVVYRAASGSIAVPVGNTIAATICSIAV